MSDKALNGARLSSYAMDPNDLVIIGLDTKDGPEHPQYDERIKLPVEESMIQSIMVYGVIEEVIVKKEGDLAIVVAGRQRVRAARAANLLLSEAGKELQKIPTKIRRGNEHDLLGVMVTENECRLEDTLPVRADKASRMLARGMTIEAVAIAFGKSVQTIESWLAFNEAIPAIRTAIENGKINQTAALRLATLPPKEQKDALELVLLSGDERGSGTRATRITSTKGKKAKDEIYEPISRPSMKKLAVLAPSKRPNDLDPMVFEILKVLLGDAPPDSIPGLTKALAAIGK